MSRAHAQSEDYGTAPQRGASETVIASLGSVEGISKSAVRLLGLWLLYKAVPPVVSYFRRTSAQAEHTEQQRDQARRDLIDTQIQQDKKDSAAIQKEIRDDWKRREQRKLPPRPRAVRGRWEGNVFVPNAEQPRGKK
jgi:hypothetical protein